MTDPKKRSELCEGLYAKESLHDQERQRRSKRLASSVGAKAATNTRRRRGVGLR